MGVVHQLTTVDGIELRRSYWVENLQLSFCLSIKITHEFKWYAKTLWPNEMKMFGLYTDIYMFIWKMWFSYLPQSYGSLSDNFFRNSCKSVL